MISVSQRTSEVGLLKALGAARRQILVLFVTEAVLLSMIGATLGLLFGSLGSWGIGRIYPDLSLAAPWWAVLAAVLTAVSSGLVFGIMPARRAAALDPVDALAKR